MADISKVEEQKLKTLKEIEEVESRIARIESLSTENQQKMQKSLEKLNRQRDEHQKKLEKQISFIEEQNEIIEKQKDLYRDIGYEVKSSIQSLGVLDVATQKVESSAKKFGTSFAAAAASAQDMGDDASLNTLTRLQTAFTEFEEAASSGDLSEFEQKWGKSIVETFVGELQNLPPEIQQLVGQSLEAFGEMQKGIKMNMGLTANELDVFKDLTSDAESLQAKFEAIGSQLNVMLKKPSLALGLFVVGIGEVVGKIGEMNSKLGMSLTSMNDMTISATALSFIFDDALETAMQLTNEFGSMSEVSFQTQLNTSLLAKNIGLSGTDTAKLVASFARLNDGSTDVANNMIVSVRETAKLKGVIPSEVMEDLAGSANSFALFAKDGGRNIAEAAIFARQLGTSFDTLTDITEGLLDFESSITKELELSAMLGRNINLNKARELAFAGKIEEATKATLDELGGIEEFNRMDMFQKKATADLLGVSVGELQKMMENSEKATGEVSLLNEKFSSVNESITAAVNNFGGGFIKTIGAGIIAVGQLGFGFQAMGTSIGGLVKGTAQVLKNIASMAAPALVNKLKGIGSAIGGSKIGEKVSSIFSGVGSRATAPTTTPSIPESASEGSSKFMESISKIDMNKVLKGAAALVIVAGAVFVLGKAMQEYADVGINNILAAAGSIVVLGLAMAGLGLLMNSPIGAGILTGAAALLIVAASVLVLGHALQAIGTGFEMMSSGIGTLMPQLSSVTTIIGGLVSLIPSISLLALSIGDLSASLIDLGVAGLISTPGLLALSTVGAISTGVGKLFGSDEGEVQAPSDNMNELITEIKGLRADLNSGKVAVYLDGKKVTASISREVDRSTTNSYAT